MNRQVGQWWITTRRRAENLSIFVEQRIVICAMLAIMDLSRKELANGLRIARFTTSRESSGIAAHARSSLIEIEE